LGAKEPEAAAGAPDWIVTFADMISLLVTFFILLMTFSTMESYDAFQTTGNLFGSAGVLRNDTGDTMTDPPNVDVMAAMDAMRGAAVPHSRPAEDLLDDLSLEAARPDDEHAEVDLNAVADGLLIRYDERASFAPGSAEISPYLDVALRELSTILEHYPHMVVVEGHTDSTFEPTSRFRTAEAVSLARAEAVAELLLVTSELDPLQIQIAGYGKDRPRETNDSPEGRRLNRRVEIRILSLSEARALKLQLEEDSDG
jgi:chemotaxis protein MotB